MNSRVRGSSHAAGRVQDGEECREQQRAAEEHPGLAPELAQQLGRPGGVVVAAADVALLDEADDAARQAEQDQHQHPAQEELPDLRVVLGDVGIHVRSSRAPTIGPKKV